MSTPESEALKHELEDLENVMHETEQFHTLEEQVADMKRRGIDPKSAYKKWMRKKSQKKTGVMILGRKMVSGNQKLQMILMKMLEKTGTVTMASLIHHHLYSCTCAL